ncbi:growth arrest-specific protein 1 [Dendrobates tinctorius]|uniref:growth arrest-specific protein 1 n=1 Tax=Dendrobates tinctorius TaxID=92724 RepID=UPI003CC94991
MLLGMAAGCALTYALLLLAALLGPCLGRMICWQALLTCQVDTECNFAYRQYTQACASVFAREDGNEPSPRRCPSHCINALIQLNRTKAGPALEDCDCGTDGECRATKQTIEPCMPRTSPGGARRVIGCTAARKQCEKDRNCSQSMASYLRHCGPLFNGLSCPVNCMSIIMEMMKIPRAVQLSDCVCDGMERPICETLKESMGRLCFGADVYGGPGSSGESDDDNDEEYDYSVGPTRAADNGALRAAPGFLLWAWSVWSLLQWYE